MKKFANNKNLKFFLEVYQPPLFRYLDYMNFSKQMLKRQQLPDINLPCHAEANKKVIANDTYTYDVYMPSSLKDLNRSILENWRQRAIV